MKIRYIEFAMPHKETFRVPAIASFVEKYLSDSKVSVDPFARNTRYATYTNDLNPDTTAMYHLDSTEFLAMLLEQGVRADLGIMDPPYSPTQLKRSYDLAGKQMTQESALRTAGWKTERDLLAKLIVPGGYVLSFGWNSCGQGRKRFFTKEEMWVICHGAGHHDTICLAERKDEIEQLGFSPNLD